MQKKLCVIGLGYIGLPNAAVFAENGFNVVGVDIDQTLVEQLNNGIVHTEEAGLADMVERLVKEDKLSAVTSPVEADIFVVAVPTPHNVNYTANLEYVEDAIQSLLPVLQKGNTIIVESTVPPRTTRDIIAPIIEKSGLKVGEDIYLAHCPERVVPGKILTELYENSRTIGGINEVSSKKAADIYRTFVRGKVMVTTAESAEMSKLMENTYRGVNIALANELTKIAEHLKIDPLEVISLANEHPRVNIHQPGPGVGGHCIPVDPYFIIEKDPIHAKLISSAMDINQSMPDFVIDQLKKVVREEDKIALFGLAYKGNIDDVRDSPAMKIADKLLDGSFNVSIYDPFVRPDKVSLKLSTFEQTLFDADVLLILTDHDEFKQLDWKRVKKLMKTPTVIDTKNCIQNNTGEINYYNYSNLYNLGRKSSITKGKQQV